MNEECTGAGDCTASPHMHGCYADRGDCDRPGEHVVHDTRRPLAAASRDCSAAPLDIWAGERRRRAEKALAETLPAGNPLWKPWAMDLADDVMALLQCLREAGKAWEDFNQQELDRILLGEHRVDDE